MKTLLIAMHVTIFVAIAAAQPRKITINSEEKAIRKILLERVESFNRHEAPQASTFTADADFVNVYGLWRKGPAEVVRGSVCRPRSRTPI
jgi:hypothetical protein